MEDVNTTEIEKQVEERMVHFERVQRIAACGVLPMESCKHPILRTIDHGSEFIEKVVADQNEVPENVTYEHTRPRGAELRSVGKEIDFLTADLMALESDLVAYPVV